MTVIAFALNCLLALLLLAAMMVGLRLEKRLRGLRDSHAGFAKAAADLNAALARAEGGLGEMRTALKDADATLIERVDEARLAAKKLEAVMQRARMLPQAAMAQPAEAFAEPAAADPTMDELPIKELLAKLRSALPVEDRGEVLTLRDRVDPVPAARSRARVDDDLFEPGLRRAGGAR